MTTIRCCGNSPYGKEESERFSAEFAAVAADYAFRILDLRDVAASSEADGIHLDAGAHAAIGTAVARELAADLGPRLASAGSSLT